MVQMRKRTVFVDIIEKYNEFEVTTIETRFAMRYVHSYFFDHRLYHVLQKFLQHNEKNMLTNRSFHRHWLAIQNTMFAKCNKKFIIFTAVKDGNMGWIYIAVIYPINSYIKISL